MSGAGSIGRRARALLICLLLPPLADGLGAADGTFDLLVVVGVPEALGEEVREALDAALERGPRGHRVVGLDALDADETAGDLARAGRLVALGADACARLVPLARPLVCALLSRESFEAIPCTGHRCQRVTAVVMDQPAERQIAVARAVYPTLRRFGALVEEVPPSVPIGPEHGALAYRRFDADAPLPRQLSAVLVGNDALLALPNSTIFNRETLHVVLLTAYGYAKPVVGYSPACVRAGALISTYSTPRQVLDEVFGEPFAKAIGGAVGDPPDGSRVRAPARFSIDENRDIARSLGLVRGADIDPNGEYSDADFPL